MHRLSELKKTPSWATVGPASDNIGHKGIDINMLKQSRFSTEGFHI